MELAVLGPLEVRDDDGAHPVEGPRRRALLAALLARPGRTVPTADLVDALWPDDPPPSAEHTPHSHASRLRRPHGLPIVARDGGYTLDLTEVALDARPP